MREGWLIDADNHWIWRFHRDEKAWIRDPKVFMDRGRLMPDGPPLLKERRYMRKEDAEQLWRSLVTQGWHNCRYSNRRIVLLKLSATQGFLVG